MKTCTWRESSPDGEYWETSCGHAFAFLVDGPLENRMRFCCYCGGPLVIVPAAAPCEDEDAGATSMLSGVSGFDFPPEAS